MDTNFCAKTRLNQQPFRNSVHPSGEGKTKQALKRRKVYQNRKFSLLINSRAGGSKISTKTNFHPQKTAPDPCASAGPVWSTMANFNPIADEKRTKMFFSITCTIVEPTVPCTSVPRYFYTVSRLAFCSSVNNIFLTKVYGTARFKVEIKAEIVNLLITF